jgi:hypothetical protein
MSTNDPLHHMIWTKARAISELTSDYPKSIRFVILATALSMLLEDDPQAAVAYANATAAHALRIAGIVPLN